MKNGMIFIDGMNLFFDWRRVTLNKYKLDIELYIELLKSKYPNLDIKRTYYFGTKTDDNEGFLRRINAIPYCEVKSGRLQSKSIKLDKYLNECCGCDKFKKTIETKVDKGTDVNIAVEMLKHAYNDAYDVAILVSRDADFSSVVRIIKDLGKTVELVLFDGIQSSAKELSSNADNITILTEQDYEKCKIYEQEENESCFL